MMRFLNTTPSFCRIVIFIAAIFIFQTSDAQVNVAGSTGADGTYPTLTAAFTGLNTAGPHNAAIIVVTITASTNEGTGSAILNAGSWTTLTIKPAVGVAATITGATNAGSPLIQLQGADNVTIDGLNTGGSSLTISNTTVSAVAGTGTLWFVSGATNNVVTNCTILGAYTGLVFTDGGTIWFGTDSNTLNGNDNNTISNNNIGPVGANLPSKAIYSLGSSSTTTNYNSGNTISGNNIYDYFIPDGQSAGIYLFNYNTQWTIQNNKFYQTATRTQTTGSLHVAIQILNLSSQGGMVSGNTIGYSSAAGTGIYSIIGVNGTKFFPIQCIMGTASMTNIQNNIITAISLSGNLSGTSNTAPFIGILGQGLVTVSGNTIGSTTVPGSISISSSSTSISEIYGISQNSSPSPLMTNNSIGGIAISNTSTGGAIFFGIRPTALLASTISTIQDNNVGFSAAPISCNSTTTNSRMVGIYVTTGAVNMTGNTVAYLTNNSSYFNGSTVDASLMGIEYQNVTATVGSTISQNHVHSLSNTNTSNAFIYITGIGYNCTPVQVSTISKNFVHSLSSATQSVSSALIGLHVFNGQTTTSNNMISLGFDESGASLTGYMQVMGLRENNGTNQFYFNSVYIGGTVATASPNSYAFYSGASSGSRDIRNNIFYNARNNNSGLGGSFAMFLNGTAPNPPGLTSNYNDLFTTGTIGVTGFFNSATHATLAAWQTATGQDANSISGNPQYINPAGSNTTIDLHIFPGLPIIESAGTPLAAITVDYDGQTRAGLTPTDIGADAGDFFVLPVLGTYPNATVVAGRNTTVTPTSAPLYLMSAAAYTTAKLDGILTVNPITGIVTITDAMPAGTYTVTVKGFGGAGTVSTTFTLTVTNPTCSQGLFYGTGTASVANFPLNIAVGDFNNDGKQDIASPSYITDAVSIRLGDGLGGFSGTTEIAVGDSPANVAVADFNGDGKQDIAVPNSGATTVSIRLGNGLGGFTGTTTVTVGTSPFGIAVGDFNNDGKSDIATTNIADATVSVNLGDGLGGFGPQSLLATGSSPRSIQVGDFNEDGNQDIAVCCTGSNSVSIFLGNGAGVFTVQPGVSVSNSPGCLVLSDFNNDNHIDLATTSSGFFAASVRYGDGLGGFSGSTEIFIDMNSSYGDLAVGDFNSDGNSDLVITRFNSSEIAIQYGNGTGTFSGSTPFSSGGFNPHLPAVGDFNGDGIHDLAFANEGNAHVAIKLGGAADINLVGNAVNVPDGSTTPSIADDTEFGNVNYCGTNTWVTHTFTFQNTGTTFLSLSGVTITGTNAADFIAYPSSFGLNPGGTQNVFVVFDPSAPGLRTATVHFNNTDCDENTYDFAVQGTGIESEIDVKGNNISIVDGANTPLLANNTDLGNQSVCNGTLSKTFKVFNSGTGALDLSGGIAFLGGQASEFSVTSSPAASVNPGDSTSFTVTFNPSAYGVRQTRLYFFSNDCDEAMYDFAIRGTGVDPEINVKGNNISIVDGDVTPSTADFTNFGVACSGTVVKTFVIENSGTQSLSITAVTITGVNASDFSVISLPAPSIAVAGSSSFQVRFTPASAGLKNATINIANDDCDEAVYDFAISGTGTTPVTGTTVVTNVACFGGSNGAINLTPSGGTGPYTFNWLPSGPTTEDRTGLVAGTYSVQITDVNGCTGTVTATVTQPTSPVSGTTVVTYVSCFGGSNGSINLTPSGGSGFYTFNWLPSGPTTEDRTGLVAGTYSVQITDVNGCTSTVTATVTQPTSPVSGTTVVTSVSCFGGANSTINLTPSGGSGSYTFNWLPSGPTTEDRTGLVAGTYSVQITDVNGCTGTVTATVTQPPAISVTAASQTNVSCFGGSNGAAAINPATGGTGAFTYNWTPGNPTGDGTTSVTGLTAGTWTVTTTDANGCTATNAFTITQPPAISFTAASQTNVSCFGGSNGAFSVNAALGGTGAFTYDWTPGNPTGDGTTSVTGLTAGTWTVTATDANGCSAAINFTITQPPAISFTAASQTNVSCFGGSNGAFSVNAALGGTGAFTYDWTPGNPTGDGTTSVTGLTAGTWTVTATDANGCSATINFTITQPPAISFTAASQTNVSCFGGNTGAFTVNAALGGTGSFTYDWTPGNPTGDGTTSVTGLTAGTWTVTTTDANGCSATINFTITQPPSISFTAASQTNVSCFGGSNGAFTVNAALGGTGAFTYDWTPGNPTGDGTTSVTGLTAGTWTVTTTDANGCSAVINFTITQPPVIVVTATSQTNVSCNGGNNGTASVTASGGTGALIYAWSSGGTNATETGLSAGNYSVIITDANSCSTTATFAITEPTAITFTSSQTDVLCNGGNNGDAMVVATGGTGSFTYAWTSGGTNATETGLSAGNYSVVITDANSCSTTATFAITEPNAITFTSSQTDVLCNGGNNGSAMVVATGGTGSFTYAWSSGGTSDTETGLSAGNYSVVITDANSCSTTATFAITEPNAITFTSSQTDVSCNGGNGGSAMVVVSGGTGAYVYTWTSGGTTDTETGLSAGNYSVTITDANSCTTTATFVIVEPAVLSASVISATNPTTCGGTDGAIDIDVTGGTASYTFLWSNSDTNEDLTGIGAGTYSVAITDANGCTTSVNTSINDPGAPAVTVSLPMDTVCGNLPVTITLSGESPAGGTWSGNNVSGNTFDAFAAGVGTHFITYTFVDVNGCTGNAIDSIYVDLCMGVEAIATTEWNLFPNPTNGAINIITTAELNSDVIVEVYSADGKLLASENKQQEKTITLDMTGKPVGVYFIRITANGIASMHRVVKI